ncbi:6307_t:CDS:2 [Entrophospora sp. SA101]|nr:6307_t:CDS:2 [Entrophospora sp. SA101]
MGKIFYVGIRCYSTTMVLGSHAENHLWLIHNAKFVVIMEFQLQTRTVMRNITGAVNASREEVVQALDTIKRTASQSHDFPLQIIQNTVVNMSQSSYSNMPGREALCKRIARVRNENIPSQPQSLQDIDW